MQILKKKADAQINDKDAEIVYETRELRIIHPKNEQASCYYGKGTRWCTTGTGPSSAFNSYDSQGPLYIIIPRRAEYNGEKYQLHSETDSLMDDGDNPITIDHLIKRFPSIKQFRPLFESPAYDKVIGDLSIDNINEYIDNGFNINRYEVHETEEGPSVLSSILSNVIDDSISKYGELGVIKSYPLLLYLIEKGADPSLILDLIVNRGIDDNTYSTIGDPKYLELLDMIPIKKSQDYIS